MDNRKKKGAQTLCWSCKNACNKCFWSKYFMPIHGWDAEPTEITQKTDCGIRSIKSYYVKACPQYEYDGITKVLTNRQSAELKQISERTLYRQIGRRRKYEKSVLQMREQNNDVPRQL